MFVTVTLNSGHGISLGPRFFLIPNVGYASPFEASISELLAGKVIEVSDSATELQVISNGACENGITLVIGAPPTTTTAAPTTTTAAPTTTTAAPTTTTAAPTTTTAAPETTTTAAPTTTTAAPTTTTTTTTTAAPQCTYDGLTIVCDATTTTTTTTTTSAAYSWVFHGGGTGYSTSAAALASFSGGPTRYSNSNAMIGNVTTFYTDSGLSTPFNGGDLWYRVQLNGVGTNYAAFINSSGVVTTYTS
jgi:hypothetical protein